MKYAVFIFIGGAVLAIAVFVLFVGGETMRTVYGLTASTGGERKTEPQYYDVHRQALAAESKAVSAVWNKMNQANTDAHYLDSNGNDKFSILKYANELAEIDCTACPQDFQDAFAKYVQDVARYGSIANLGTALASGLETLHGKDATFTAFNEAKARLDADQIEIKRVASQHGVTFQQ